MTSCGNDKKVTFYLDELGEEYKELLFRYLLEKNNGLEEISISELLRLDSEIKSPLIKKNDKRKRVTYQMAIIGVCYAFTGIGIFLFYNTNMDLTPLELISLMVALAGICIATLSLALPKILPRKTMSKKSNEASIRYQVISTWRDIEGITNELTEVDASIKNGSPIDKLYENGLINEGDKATLRTFLSLRNKIVHHTEETFDTQKAMEILSSSTEVLEKLRKVL